MPLLSIVFAGTRHAAPAIVNRLGGTFYFLSGSLDSTRRLVAGKVVANTHVTILKFLDQNQESPGQSSLRATIQGPHMHYSFGSVIIVLAASGLQGVQ